MKIKFIFETNAGEKITNDRLYTIGTDREGWSDDDYENIGCTVDFNKIPMLQDYQTVVNEIWFHGLQFTDQLQKNDKRLKKVTTELIDF